MVDDTEIGELGTAAPAPAVSIARLPVAGTRIFGRVADTAWLDACWAEGANVASVVAPGGVGKTALVGDWLGGMGRDGWRGAERVYGWSFYSQGTTDRATSADEFVSAALRWFGDADSTAGSPWDKGERLARLVRAKRTLLVLDGVEPLQWGPGEQEGRIKDPALATLVRELGAQNPGLCVITSRLPAPEAEEGARGTCRRLDLSTLTEEAGSELLRARGVNGEEAELREAVREYGGHSLALALLGSYLEDVAGGDVRRRHEIGPLVEDERLGGHARRVMAAYEKMLGSGSVEVAILRMLGLFDRPASEGEIAALREAPAVPGLTEAVVGIKGRVWSKALAKLRRVGLVARAENERDTRLDAHPLVREHFGEQLRRERPEAWREGHRRLYEHLRGKAKPLPDTVEDMAPLYAAVVHGCRAGKGQEALEEVWWERIRRGANHFSARQLGAFGSEAAVLSAFFDPPWERLAPGPREADEALVLSEAGIALRALGRLAEGARLMRMGLDKGISMEDWEESAIRASNLAELLQARGELREALVEARRSVELADRRGDTFRRTFNRTTLAAALHATGEREEAAALFEEAERMQEEMQPAYPRLYAFRYCDLLLDQGRDAEMRKRGAKFFEWRGPGGSLLTIALTHLCLGRACLLAVQRSAGGDLAQTASHLAASVDGFRRAGRQDYLPLALLARAALHTHTRAFDLARHDLDEALSFATRCGFRLHEADARLGLARLALAQQDPAAARAHLDAARAIITATGYHRRDEELDALETLHAKQEEEKTARAQGAQGSGREQERISSASLRPCALAVSSPDSGTPTPTPSPAPRPAMTTAVKLFYSYSHKDESLRDELETHLALLKHQGLLEDWHDRRIGAGSDWAGAIDENLAKADLVLLLVSADFLASAYCYDTEMKRAIERHDAGEAVVVPIALRPCDCSGAPFAKLQGFPRDMKSVTTWTNKDEAWTEIAKGLRRAIEDLRKRRAGAAEHDARPR